MKEELISGKWKKVFRKREQHGQWGQGGKLLGTFNMFGKGQVGRVEEDRARRFAWARL